MNWSAAGSACSRVECCLSDAGYPPVLTSPTQRRIRFAIEIGRFEFNQRSKAKQVEDDDSDAAAAAGNPNEGDEAAAAEADLDAPGNAAASEDAADELLDGGEEECGEEAEEGEAGGESAEKRAAGESIAAAGAGTAADEVGVKPALTK
eukprot:3784475-Pyramimonas_sp.AAC.1